MNPEESALGAVTRQPVEEDAARALLESLRWPSGVVCPHCRRKGAYALTAKPASSRPVRKGVWKCRSCRQQFTVRVGTFFQDSHIPISKWVMAVSLICGSRSGISAKQLERLLGLSYKSAWSMSRRLRLAMAEPPLRALLSATTAVNMNKNVGGRKPVRQRGDLGNKTSAA